MTPEPEEAQWRNRFILMNLARIGATALVMVGLLIWQTDVIVPRTIIGFPIAIVALFASFLAPRYLAHRWRTPPGP